MKLYELGCRLGYQGPRSLPSPGGGSDKSATGIHTAGIGTTSNTQTPPTSQPADTQTLNVLQLNISSIQNKKMELAKMLSDSRIHVALLQETQLPKRIEFHLTGYTMYHCKCTKCQGIATLIRNDITAEVSHPETDDETDMQEVKVQQSNGTTYTIYNVYCPPRNTLQLNFPNADYKNTIFAGDFNGHSPLWGYSDTDTTGTVLEELLRSSNLISLQNDKTPPTLLHRASGTLSRPDLTLVSADLHPHCSMTVLDDIGSDHRPILLQISSNRKRELTNPIRRSWNYKKANWELYQQKSESRLLEVCTTSSIDECYKDITTALMTSAKEAIPRGNPKKFRPYWDKELEQLTKARKKARRHAEKNPTAENRKHYNYLTAKVKLKSKSAKRKTWREHCGELDLRKDGRKAWNLLTNLSGTKRRKNPAPMKPTEEGKTCRAEVMNKYFASINKKGNKNKLSHTIKQLTKRAEQTPKANLEVFEKEFTLTELKAALQKCKKRKAPGPDHITNEMILNLTDSSLSILLDFFNRTWYEGQLPTEWKKANITPILKKDKPASQPSSYRPISLTSCLGKVVERMVNDRLYWWMENTGTISTSQAGFRKGKRTMDHLIRFAQETSDAFQDKDNVVAVFIDLRQAYDRVWRQGLFYKMQKLGIAGRMYSWIKNFLSCRTIQTSSDNKISSQRTLEEGLPQGSALSCTLFLLFMNDLPDAISCQKALYADDLLIWSKGSDMRALNQAINADLTTISSYCQLWKMEINTDKTVFGLFSLKNKVTASQVNLKINGTNIKHEDYPKYLGVQLDRKLSLKEHLGELTKKATSRLNLLKHLSSLNWGADKETLRQLYIGYIRSVIDYSLPLQSIASHSSLAQLDRVQNQALRFVSGAMKTTPTSACEIHTNIEPLDLRRKSATLETFERFVRLEDINENRKMADKWEPRTRIHKTSFMREATKLLEEFDPPENREQITNISSEPPYWQVPEITIRTRLLDPSCDKTTPEEILRTSALETVDSYAETPIHAYTDGSATNATRNAGYGSIIKYRNNLGEKKQTQLFGPCGTYSSNYDAERVAIVKTLEQITQDFLEGAVTPGDVVVFSDSMSVLQAVEGGGDYRGDKNILSLVKQMGTSYGVRVTLQWVPGHSGVPGNETADQLSKTGASLPQTDTVASLQTCRGIIQAKSRDQWLNRWANAETGRSLFRHMDKPNPKDPSSLLCRADQSLIFRARTGHLHTNKHINRINPMWEPHCRHCDYHEETVEHLLLHCPNLAVLRRRLLHTPTDLQNLLYSGADQMTRTCGFLREALRCQERNARS